MKPLWIIGSGGHAKVAIDAARSTGEFTVCGCLDDDPDRLGQRILGVEVTGPISSASIENHNIEIALIAIGSNTVRCKIARRFASTLSWATVIHAHSWVAASATIEPGTLVCAGSVVQPESRIGPHAILNTSASIDHDCTIGAFAHIGPGAHLAGTVTVGEGTFVGLGAGIIPGVTIGEWSVIGAGAVVTQDVASNVTAVGVPARTVDERPAGWHLD